MSTHPCFSVVCAHTHTHTRSDAHLEYSTDPPSTMGVLIRSPPGVVGESELVVEDKGTGVGRGAQCPPRLPPAPLHLRFLSPRSAQLPAEMAWLRREHRAASRSPCLAEWSRRVDPPAPIHSSPFTTFRLYKDWLIPIFFFLLPLQ